jgi:hypothetical protein
MYLNYLELKGGQVQKTNLWETQKTVLRRELREEAQWCRRKQGMCPYHFNKIKKIKYAGGSGKNELNEKDLTPI